MKIYIMHGCVHADMRKVWDGHEERCMHGAHAKVRAACEMNEHGVAHDHAVLAQAHACAHP
jgi:hypothetical protein